MFIPLAVMIPCSIVAFFEFWQDTELSDARNKLIRQVQKLQLLQEKLIRAELLPEDVYGFDEEQLFKTELSKMLPEDFNDDIVEFGYDMDPGVAMHYDSRRDRIVVNFFLARHLFFDENGQNTKNKKLFHTFLKHELAHREFADPQNKVRFFIHKTFPWLEEFLVSFGDVFRPLTFTFQKLRPAEQSIVSSYVESSATKQPVAVAEVTQSETQTTQVEQAEESRETSVKSVTEQAEPEIEPIPIIQEEKIDIDPMVEAFARLVKELPFEMQHSFVKAVLGNDALTARFIRIITISDETKWKKELSGTEISVTDITDAIKASFTLEQGTMRTTEDGKIKFNLQDVQRSLDNGRSGIISLTVKSMRELDHISYIEAKDFKGFKNGLKAFIHRRLGFLERIQAFIAGLWRFVSLHITTSSPARKFTTEWAGVSVTWIPPYGIDLPDTLQDARIDDERRLIEPFVLYGKQRFAGNRRGTITRIVRVTYKNGRQAYLKNFKPGQKLSDDIAAVEISYNFESETCAIQFDMGNIEDGFVSPHPLIAGIRNHDVGNGYHVDGLGNNLPVRRGHNLLGCRYVTMSGKIITISKEGLENGFDIAGEELSGDVSIQLIWEPIVHVVNVEFYDRGDRQELNRGRQQVKVIDGHDARIKGFAPGVIDATANWFKRFFTGLSGNKTGIPTHTITWAKLPQGLSWPDNYNTFGLTEDFASSIEEGVTLEMPPMRLGHIMLPNGRIGTVRCKVIDTTANQEIIDFQMGKTSVDRDLRIEYEFTPDKAEYSLNFEANGGTLDSQPVVKYDRKTNSATVRTSHIPTREGYTFKGYKVIKCTHQTALGVSLGDDRYETIDINPERVGRDSIEDFIIENVFGDVVLVAQWEKNQISVTREQQPASKGFILKSLTAVGAVVTGAWGHLSTRQKITFVFAGVILLAALIMSSLLTYGIIAVSFSFFISIGLYIIQGIASFILARLIYVMIKGFLFDMLKAIGNFLIKSFKLIVLAGGKTLRRSYRVTRQVFRAPINYARNFYENMTNIADNLSGIPTKEGYEFGGFSVTNDTTKETAEFSLEEIKRDFIVPGRYFSQNEVGESIVKLNYIWIPKVTITTGAGTNIKKDNKPLETSSREINLADYKDLLIPPEGHDYTSLYWTCDAYPGQEFAANAVVKLDKRCTFMPNWKPLPEATISVGNGKWKGASAGDATRQRTVQVTATRQGAMVNLRKLRDELEAPDDCDPDSLYFTKADSNDPIEENGAGEVLMKSDTVYTPHWKTLAESNKARLKIGEGQSIILTADKDGFIDLAAVVRDHELKPPEGFTENPYLTVNSDKDTKLTGKIDIKHTSVLTLHWDAFNRNAPDYSGGMELLLGGQEGVEELQKLELFPEYPIQFNTGVEIGGVDDVTARLNDALNSFFKTKVEQGKSFSTSIFKKNQPKREGYRFKGVKVTIGGKSWTFPANETISIDSEYITGHITMTMLWEKEYSVTSSDPDLSAVLGNLKAYEGNSFEFPGFGTTYPIPKKTGFKFKGVRVQVGTFDKEFGTEPFTIPKGNIADTITMTAVWETHSPITFTKENIDEMPEVPEGQFYYKGDNFHFKGFYTGVLVAQMGRYGYTPTKPGYKFLGVSVQNGSEPPEQHLGNDPFDITVNGPIQITYLWAEDYHVTLGDKVLSNKVLHEGENFHFEGFGSKTIGYYPIPTKAGFKFKGISVKNGDEPQKEYLVTDTNNPRAIFDITVQGPIEITYLWEQEVEQKKGWLWKSEESAQGAAQAAAEIGMLLGTQVAGSMFVANGPLNLMKSAMDSFAELERSQVEQIGEAQTLVSQNNYFKGKANEEILRQLLSNSELSPEDASMFLKFLSDVEIETSGEVMSYEPNTQDPSKPGKMHVNYKMLRAMFLDPNGNTKNIELFKVFVKHELTHMEFATSDNPLYKAAHNIPFLEEFLVSFSDLYVWQQAQLILPEYTNVVKFIFTNARILSIAAGISIEEAERISKLYTGLPQREMTIELLPAVQGELSDGSTSAQTSTLRPLSLFVANASDGSLTPASSYADKLGGAASDYTTAVVEHIPSTVLVPTGYSRRMSVNVSFNGLAYDVYVRQNAQGKCFIGLKLKGGADLEQNPTAAAQNFAAAAQYFANDLNTNTVLREELNRATNLGISAEGVAMMDFVGFPPTLQTSQQQLTQQLYESGDMSQGLVGVYTA
ncbi:InlB B-repeat-containing protein [Candidatus Endomicrobiellum devescovinae]|uniref:InlB B-repeat-containing protein n=1 Tax=Candidatus Endomicrobiellum devescovinae TaxID=3242322 RepID=UPI003593F07C